MKYRRKFSEQLRPTTGKTKEALFSIIRASLPNARFLDLFAGTGAIGLEAKKNGATSVFFVDKAAKRVQNIRAKLTHFGDEENYRVFTIDVFQWLNVAWRKQIAPFDIIFADPPYHESWSKRCYSDKLLKSEALRGLIKNEDSARLILEVSKKLEAKLDDSAQWIFEEKRDYGDSSLLFFKPNYNFPLFKNKTQSERLVTSQDDKK